MAPAGVSHGPRAAAGGAASTSAFTGRLKGALAWRRVRGRRKRATLNLALQGGGARAHLEALWRQIGQASAVLANSQLPAILELAVQLLAPHQLNPLGINPLRETLERLVDFERLRRERSLKLLVAATNVRTGAPRIFKNHELSVDAVLASACLPRLHHAVEIDGEAYWDGSYVSNPPLAALVEACSGRDLLLIRINPSERPAVPTSAGGIREWIGEIVFERPLEHELALLRARRFRLRLASRQWRLLRHRLHVVDGRDVLAALDPATRLLPDPVGLARLRALGRAAAEAWLHGRPSPR